MGVFAIALAMAIAVAIAVAEAVHRSREYNCVAMVLVVASTIAEDNDCHGVHDCTRNGECS